MEALQNVINQSQGRDRLLRATQFASALCAHALRNHSRRKELVSKFKSLEANLSGGRKLFRLGNAIDAGEAAKRSARLSDPVLRLCLTAANVNRALYLMCDNALWAAGAGLLPSLDRGRWGAGASRFYLLSLLMSLTRDAYLILRLALRRARDGRETISHPERSPEAAPAVIPHLDASVLLLPRSFKSHPALVLDAVKNACDLSIPLDRLGIYRSDPGALAFCGLLSSLIGIATLVRPELRLKA
ncbi:peroxisomal membrane protein 11A isoform X2 [Hippocampus comes]|uniref:peroxisomal membrane protein 11A isoform X1 n=1 Tax=Hippocampus comes TaxID=109280 RepID=UPI00094F2386|nr:PREDICTED: peroxisomal membrane protein 11B-like isoform X1 [Hippocampus comes]XP_019737368.1 PREDICTED: peroxisomal membrane protein 11B-like isoform X1 [Hippocampus comes]XP_019737369.1 PREDICTED: peroxisomal membrane protein 11B-like isoform X2 [Hippocampus comes]